MPATTFDASGFTRAGQIATLCEHAARWAHRAQLEFAQRNNRTASDYLLLARRAVEEAHAAAEIEISVARVSAARAAV